MNNNNCSILIVDDNYDDIALTQRAISKFNAYCNTEAVTDGDKAMKYMECNAPSLVILDLKLPGMSGIDLLRFIRSRNETCFTPVIMLSSSNLDSDIREAYDAGANSFINKSHDLMEFTDNLRSALHYWVNLNLVPN
jgi:CheY-like chemotaxis protein